MDIVRNTVRLSDQGKSELVVYAERMGESEKLLHIWAETSSRQTALQGGDVTEH